MGWGVWRKNHARQRDDDAKAPAVGVSRAHAQSTCEGDGMAGESSEYVESSRRQGRGMEEGVADRSGPPGTC